jgi:hypothetical protein
VSSRAPAYSGSAARERILRSQAALVQLLSDPAMLEPAAPASLDDELAGLDVDRVALLAQLAHGKRMTKIAAFLPATCTQLGDSFGELARAFAYEHRPISPESAVNALQFYVFLARRWRREPPPRPFLPDLMWCELALAPGQRRGPTAGVASSSSASETAASASEVFIRRARDVRLRRCSFDVLPLLRRPPAPTSRIEARTVHVAIGRGRRSPRRLMELDADTFELVASLVGWNAVRLDADAEIRALVERLEAANLVDVRVPPSHGG